MYKHICVGGTFDHLHIGHQKLLIEAFEKGAKVTIGLTSKQLIKNKKLEHIIEDYNKRKYNLINFISKSKWKNDYSIIPINSIYGIALDDKSLDAIVVTKESLNNARKINAGRIKNKITPLSILIVNLVKDNSSRHTVRSERIRAGAINSDGYNYLAFFNNFKNLKIPEKLKYKLREPFGKIFYGNDFTVKETTIKVIEYLASKPKRPVIAVGDVISNALKKQGFNTSINIIDNRNQRKPFKNTFNFHERAINPPGQLRRSAISKLKKFIKNIFATKQQTLEIIGEEDLLVLPAILLSPLETYILYGQKGIGVIIVEVSNETKKNALTLLKLFEKNG